VAKEQAKQSREQQPTPSLAASDSLAQDNERKKKMAKAIETAEARFVSYNLKVNVFHLLLFCILLTFP